MTATLVADFDAKGYRVGLNASGRLTVKAREGSVPAEILTEVREHRNELEAFLKAQEAALPVGGGAIIPDSTKARSSAFGTCPTCGQADWVAGSVPLACRACGYQEPERFRKAVTDRHNLEAGEPKWPFPYRHLGPSELLESLKAQRDRRKSLAANPREGGTPAASTFSEAVGGTRKEVTNER
ncbi:MAG: hypothetical protein FJZ00_00410 [Candidatus Sericytochromatia bacterium]|uniref:Uncharacterized protein n=1 Tax=Candidatus Tanganyikabacteria bacterium TaxID=2961651 RepID=A0A937X3J3_9BACT|nr:hypothetical protein [Candidatus Tanganyikabacteria bacterium]